MLKNIGFTSRSFRFQLTALVDLLLIIVFMQFLELRQHEEQKAEEYRSNVQRLEIESKAAHDQLQSTQTVIRRALDDSNHQLDETKRALKSSENSIERMVSALQAAFASNTETDSGGQLNAMVEQQLLNLAEATPDQVARFLVGYSELMKRAEVWTLHARETGEIILKAGEVRSSFRLEAGAQSDRAQEFADRLFASYKQLNQPKGLVIILASYDLRATAGVYQAIIDGLPKAIEQMRSDAASTRFEFSVLGATADPLSPSGQ